ncbi:transcriptional regulator [Parashewanella spongiae]|uniref:Transcriptional regulator n=1 Tax=Parashewanella spongiae TaxID=342950 RepID=A0A3A6U1X0_9GAMM|nr:metalloregulator ArsR/SmtB family transcription factor [Parashewanella spongiae]MCL1077813.1 transcriptional regulator [Parashewanella spongiae]RJY18011.1 transcriptional regulator [Parashewanella spongiae]
MKTTEKILNLLKVHGPLTAKFLSKELALTTMGVRQHLQLLEDNGDVATEDRAQGRGRPTRYWYLTEGSASHFDDRHEELTLQLIDSVIQVFGDGGLDKLITAREKSSFAQYDRVLALTTNLEEKLQALCELRSNEGYMASCDFSDKDYWLYENHCPICAAATKCQNFCRSELEMFQKLFEQIASVSREEHIIEGARRCAYKFSPFSSAKTSEDVTEVANAK